MDRATISAANWEDVAYFWPVVILGLVACVIIVQDMFEERQTWAAPFLAKFGLPWRESSSSRAPPRSRKSYSRAWR